MRDRPAVLCEKTAHRGDGLVPGLEAWLSHHPNARVIAYLLGEIAAGTAIRLVELGVTDFVTWSIDDGPEQWEKLLFRSFSADGDEEFLAAIAEDLPPSLLPFLVGALEHARDRLPVDRLAGTTVYRASTTVRKAVREAGLPPPARLARWARVYRGVRIVENTGMSLARASSHFGYGSLQAFTNQATRLTGHPPTRILERGGTAFLLKLLRREVRSPDRRRNYRKRVEDSRKREGEESAEAVSSLLSTSRLPSQRGSP